MLPRSRLHTAAARARVLGTRMGLKMMNKGVAKARPMRVPVRVMSVRRRRNPPTGRPATTARTWDSGGTLLQRGCP